MAETLTKSPIGEEDIFFDTPGGGTPASQNVTTSVGGVQAITALSANSMPVLDAPIVTNARTPFAKMKAADPADVYQNVEKALQQLRINAREMKNIEHYGAISGVGKTDAEAERNTLAWQKALDEINLEGRNNGIFFPGTYYEFKDLTVGPGAYGGNILPLQTSGGVNVGNLFIVGTPATTCIAHGNASVNKPLIYATGTSNVFFDTMSFLHLPGSATNLIFLDPAANGVMNTIRFNRVSMGTSNRLLKAEWGGLGNYVKNLWVIDCLFGNSPGHGLSTEDVAGAIVRGNVFSGSNQGIDMTAAGTESFGYYDIVGNQLTYGITTQNINVSVLGAAFTPAVHHTVKVLDNAMSFGSLSVTNINNASVERNTMTNGTLWMTFASTMASVYDIKVRDNTVVGIQAAALPAIQINNASANMRRWWVTDNDVYLSHGHGIYIVMAVANARMRDGEVRSNMILDPSQAGANTYDGICIDANSIATAGMSECLVESNKIRSTNAALRMRRGISELGGGSLNDFNYFRSNMVKGWQTGAILMSGAASRDTVGPNAAPLAGSETTIDLGAAV